MSEFKTGYWVTLSNLGGELEGQRSNSGRSVAAGVGVDPFDKIWLTLIINKGEIK